MTMRMKLLTKSVHTYASKIVNEQQLQPLFLSTSFTSNTIESNENPSTFVNRHYKKYDSLYRHLSSVLIGNNWKRKKHLFPRTIDFIDFSNSRNSNKFPGYVGLHFHSIWFVNPALVSKISSNTKSSIPLELNLTNFDIKPLTTVDYRLISYCCKAAKWQQQFDRDGVDWFHLFPITQDERQIRRQDLLEHSTAISHWK